MKRRLQVCFVAAQGGELLLQGAELLLRHLLGLALFVLKVSLALLHLAHMSPALSLSLLVPLSHAFWEAKAWRQGGGARVSRLPRS